VNRKKLKNTIEKHRKVVQNTLWLRLGSTAIARYVTVTLTVGMCGIPYSEKYRGIKSDGIMYLELPKYLGIPSGGTDFQ